MDRSSDQFQIALSEAFESLENFLIVVSIFAGVGAVFDFIVMSFSDLSFDVADVESVGVVIEVHMLENAVHVGGRGVIFEFPLLIVSYRVVRQMQFSFAKISVVVQIMSGADCEIGVSL